MEGTDMDERRSSIGHRGTWDSKWEFLLSCIGLTVGLGNIWRFPYLAYDNGGGAFLLPYTIMLFLVGIPVYYMELAFGQYAGQAPLTIWSCVPLAKGVGCAVVTICTTVTIYYNVILSYVLYYMWASMQKVLPWTTCDNEWNTVACYIRGYKIAKNLIEYWNSSDLYNGTFRVKTSSEEFWENKVLGLNVVVNRTIVHTYSISDLGGIKWDVALNLLLSWIVLFFCLMRGIRTSGKVVYFTATFPYIVLLVLMLRGVTLEGAATGIKHLIVPKWSHLKHVHVWRNALTHVIYSLSVGWGCLITLASYNKFSHNCYRDALIVCCVDTLTSLIAGFVVFSAIGALAYDVGVDFGEVFQGGAGLTFITYPEAIGQLPTAQFWSTLFFFMLYVLGVDSEFGMLQCVLSSISDQFTELRRHKLVFTLAFCTSLFIIALPATMRGGSYVWSLMDKYGADFPVLLVTFFEIVAVIWIYGYKKFRANIVAMLGYRPGIYWEITWIVVSPMLTVIMFILTLVDFPPLPDQRPPWVTTVGWLLFCSSLVQIPIVALCIIVSFCRKEEGSRRERFLKTISKNETFDDKWKRNVSACAEVAGPSEDTHNLHIDLGVTSKENIVLRLDRSSQITRI